MPDSSDVDSDGAVASTQASRVLVGRDPVPAALTHSVLVAMVLVGR